jgi:thioredoxin reductase (NADPH)
MNKDVIIIGGGAGGLSAGHWCAGLGLQALVLEKGSEPGGQLLWTFNPIHNYPGVTAEDGRHLRDLIIKQIESSSLETKLEIKTGAEVSAADLQNKSLELADGAVLTAKALVIASGIRRRKLNVPGETEFTGKGILMSGARDKELARGKDAVIVGGGDAAFENALILAGAARSVMIIHRNANFRARGEFQKKVENDPRIKVLADTILDGIEGQENIERLALRDRLTGYKFTVPVQAVLIRIGVEPNTELFQGQIELDEKGFILVNSKCETSVADVYAAGDAASPHSMTVSTAAGMGATAAHMILKKSSK